LKGVNKNTAAIRDAIDAAVKNRGGIVYLMLVMIHIL